ncbi:MAG: histidine phosphatase family protein [Pseudomonadota bacterium]
MLITLLRHAEIHANDKGRYIGHTDSPLSQFGEQDAITFAKYFVQYNQNNNFDYIYSSDLKRCKQSLKPFLSELNLAIEPVYSKLLREKFWGKHEGKNFDEICKMENTEYINFEQWINVLDGESIEEFIRRVKIVLEELKQNDYKNILIMSHAGVIRTLIYLLSQLSFETSFYTSLPYASFVVLKI